MKDGNVVIIIDWNRGFANALLKWGWQSDWTDYVVQIFQPYYAELFMRSSLMEKLLV